MLVEIGVHWRTPDWRGNDQDFGVALAARDEPMREARFKMRGIARLQIISFSRERQCQFAGQDIDPFLAIVMVMLVAVARDWHFDPERLDVKKPAGLRQRS